MKKLNMKVSKPANPKEEKVVSTDAKLQEFITAFLTDKSIPLKRKKAFLENEELFNSLLHKEVYEKGPESYFAEFYDKLEKLIKEAVPGDSLSKRIDYFKLSFKAALDVYDIYKERQTVLTFKEPTLNLFVRERGSIAFELLQVYFEEREFFLSEVGFLLGNFIFRECSISVHLHTFVLGDLHPFKKYIFKDQKEVNEFNKQKDALFKSKLIEIGEAFFLLLEQAGVLKIDFAPQDLVRIAGFLPDIATADVLEQAKKDAFLLSKEEQLKRKELKKRYEAQFETYKNAIAAYNEAKKNPSENLSSTLQEPIKPERPKQLSVKIRQDSKVIIDLRTSIRFQIA